MKKPRQPFAMKQFTIAQNDVALPVTSDACLFGSMIQLPKNAHVLDIGTGTGLLCFMLAQKHPDASFTGIDIHPGSIQQAIENNHNNPFKNQIEFQIGDAQLWEPTTPYHAIVCNPPFFENHLPSQNNTRRLARHSNELTLPNLLKHCNRLLHPNGELFLLYPNQNINQTQKTFSENHLQIQEITFIQATENKPPHLAIFRTIKTPFNQENAEESPKLITKNVIHYQTNGQLTLDATHYLQEFYTRL
jgi:tRNA1Val (adenine37-N6)-methyltransferase